MRLLIASMTSSLWHQSCKKISFHKSLIVFLTQEGTTHKRLHNTAKHISRAPWAWFQERVKPDVKPIFFEDEDPAYLVYGGLWAEFLGLYVRVTEMSFITFFIRL